MIIENEFLAAVGRIQAARRDKKLVVFTGAGISKDSGVPLWPELIAKLKAEIDDLDSCVQDDFFQSRDKLLMKLARFGISDEVLQGIIKLLNVRTSKLEEQEKAIARCLSSLGKVGCQGADLAVVRRELETFQQFHNEYFLIPQIHYETWGDLQHRKRIEEILRPRKGPNDLHKLIISLGPSDIISTNYDSLLEEAAASSAAGYSVVSHDRELPQTETHRLLVKMHGDFRQGNMVLKRDDYLYYADSFPLIESYVKSLFASKLVLFVGFSGNDPNLQSILRWIKDILEKDYQPPYLFVTDCKTDSDHNPDRFKEKLNFLEENGVHPLPYASMLGTEYGQEDRGARTRVFLELINDENRFLIEKFKHTHLLEAIYQNLIGLEGFAPVAKELINLPVFQGESRSKLEKSYSYEFHLKTNDEALLAFFKQVSESIEGAHVRPKADFAKELWEAQVFDAQEKLQYIVETLNKALIFCVHKDADTHHRIQLKSTEACYCPSCNYNNLRFDALLRQLDNGELERWDEDEPGIDKLKAPLVLGLIGEPRKAIELYAKHALQSFNKGEYFSYVLAGNNARKLLGLLDTETREQIEKRYEFLLEVELVDLPISRINKRQIEKIESEILTQRLNSQVQTTIDKIKKVKALFDKPGSSRTGPNEASRLLEKAATLREYHRQNYLWMRPDARGSLGKAVIGFLLSHATNSEDDTRLEAFNAYHVELAVHYANPDELAEMLGSIEKEGSCLNLKMESEAERKLIELSLNFFRSFYDDAFGKPSLKQTIRNQIDWRREGGIYFDDDVKQIFRRLIWLLSYSSIAPQELKEVNKALIGFLQAMANQGSTINKLTMNGLAKYLDRKGESLSRIDLIQLLKLSTESRNWRGRTERRFLQKLSHLFKLLSPEERLSKGDLCDKLIAAYVECTHGRRESNFSHLPHFYHAFTGESQQKLKETLLHELKEGFDSNAFMFAVDEGILIPEDFYDTWANQVSFHKQNGSYIYAEQEGDITPYGFDAINFLAFAFRHNLDVPTSLIEKEKGKHPYFDWLLDPDTYDYQTFDARWVLNFPVSDHPERFRNCSKTLERVKSYLGENQNSEMAVWLVRASL